MMKRIMCFLIICLLIFSYTLCFALTETVSLKSGWNLIGVNYDNVSPSQLGSAEKVKTVWSWDNGMWKIYSEDPDINSLLESYGIEKFSELSSGSGYWVNIKSDISPYNAELIGNMPHENVITLSGNGWFLAGIKNPEITSIKPEDFFSSPNVNTIWQWKDNSWAVWSSKSEIADIIKNYSIPLIDSINSTDGFWINYTSDVSIEFKTSGEGVGGDSGIYGQFYFPPENSINKSSDNDTLEFPPSPVIGKIEGINDNSHEVVFASDNGTTYIAPVSDNGTFQLELPPMPFTISLLNEGNFETAAFAEKNDNPDISENDNVSQIGLKYENGKLIINSGNFITAGEALKADNGTPVGLAPGNQLLGLTDKGKILTEKTTSIDADKDGIPDMFDPDADGDGIIDSVDSDVKALLPPPMPGITPPIIPGARAFTNLKIDPDGNPAQTSLKFMYNDYPVITLEFLPDDYSIFGYVVDNVTVERMPNWTTFGFDADISDWKKLTPSGEASFDGQLQKESDGRWDVFLMAPEDNGTLSTQFPDYVENGGRIPLTFDFSDNRTKPMTFLLKITYKSKISGSTLTKYSFATTIYTFRTPPLVETITTDNGTCNYNLTDRNGCGHINNPVVYPGSGDVVITGLPPKLSSSTSLIMWGTMRWKPTIFYYDASGNQIGQVMPEPITITSTPASHPTVTVPERFLKNSDPNATDIDGDSVDDLYSGYKWSDVRSVKIDYTAETLSSDGGNAAMFIYLTF